MKKRYRIITSCDDRLAAKVAVTIYTLSQSLKDDFIDFYLLHSRVSEKNTEMLSAFCDYLANVKFHSIRITNPEDYELLAQNGGKWGVEAYYPLCAHTLLPQSVERALYLDAGDIMVLGDISPYYFDTFDGNLIIGVPETFKWSGNTYGFFQPDDLFDENHLDGITRGIINTGSYVINLDGMRRDGIDLEQYIELSKTLYRIKKENGRLNTMPMADRKTPMAYFGDQGLLSAALIGKIKMYDIPNIIKYRSLYAPYNFGIHHYIANPRPGYDPVIFHFCFPEKPWKMKYPIFIDRFQDQSELLPLKQLTAGIAEYYFLWHEYAIITNGILNQLNL